VGGGGDHENKMEKTLPRIRRGLGMKREEKEAKFIKGEEGTQKRKAETNNYYSSTARKKGVWQEDNGE